VCNKYFKIPQYEILGNKNKEYRNIAIYLIKKYSAFTNYQISQLFTDINCSTVAKAYQRFLKKLKEAPFLQKRVREIIIERSNVKGYPLSYYYFYKEIKKWPNKKIVKLSPKNYRLPRC